MWLTLVLDIVDHLNDAANVIGFFDVSMQNSQKYKMMSQLKKFWIRKECNETEIKYQNSTHHARELLLPFLSSYLAECEFSEVNVLVKKS